MYFMPDYYTPRKTYGLYIPGSPTPFKVSRTKIDLFMKCPKSFYLDRVYGVAQPPGYPFSLNAAVDRLLKKEFDLHRARHTSHPLMKAYGVDAVPFDDPRIDQWRDSLRGGVSFLHHPTNLIICGGIDDLWINPQGELIVVDYKATAKDGKVTLDAKWQDGYKRQAEIYQWLFAQNGFKVSPTAYFVYCNGRTDREAFDGKLEFDIVLIPYEGNTGWVEPTVDALHQCLNANTIPHPGDDCEFCRYRAVASQYDQT
jgi:hypothetical protein